MMLRLLAVFAFLLGGCTQTPPTSFYTLTGLPAGQTDAAEIEPLWPVVALAPVALPAYLDRPQLVVRLDAARMQIADFANWIEPLDVLIQRALAAHLEQDQRIGQVVKLPQRRPVSFGLGVEIQIDRFEARADKLASIDVDWLLIDGRERELVREDFKLQVPVAEPAGFAEGSQALALLIEELARAILNALPEES